MTAIHNPGAPDGRNSWEDEPTDGAALLREAAQTLREKAEWRASMSDERYDLAVADWLEEAVGLAGAIAEYREGFIKPPEGVVRLTDRALAVAGAVLRRES